MDWFVTLRTISYTFATLMLVKYFVFLMLAPFYPLKENLRKIRMAKRRKEHGYAPYQPLVTVIIPAWNEEVGLQRTIRSVLNSNYKKFEIIIVNDGSTDRTDELVRKLINSKDIGGKRLRYISKSNGGKGTALNVGIERARGEIIFTLDADSMLAPSALRKIVNYFADETIAAVVGNVKVGTNYTILGYLQQLEYQFGFYFKRAHAVLGAEYIFGGANSAFRKSAVFDQLGHYDTANKTEDIEMSMRTRFYGLRCTYAEDAVVYTEGASSVMGLINQRLRWKKGRFDTFGKYRMMFFSFNRNHNKALSFFVLPFSLLAEFQLLFEPIAIALLVTYSVISGDYISLALGSLFVFTLYVVNALFAHEGRPKLILSFIFTWPLFYILVWIEYVALIKSIQLIFRGTDVEWQNWSREGLIGGEQ